MDTNETRTYTPDSPEDIAELFTTITLLTGDGLCLVEMVLDDDGTPHDYRIIEANDLFEQHTSLTDVVGRTGRELTPGLDQSWVEAYARVGLGRETLRFENESIDVGRWFEVNATPAPAHGQLFIIFRDITERKKADLERIKALDRANKLLAELNHRVKNSLAIITSVLSLEKRAVDEASKEVIERIGLRVDAVRGLYATLSGTGSISDVDTEIYLSEVIEGLKGAHARGERVQITSRIESFTLPAEQAVSLGLVVNELVTNAVKHAFTPGILGHIEITLVHDGDEALLTVRDDGNHALDRNPKQTGLGSRLIEAFAANLGGTLETDSALTGTTVTLRF